MSGRHSRGQLFSGAKQAKAWIPTALIPLVAAGLILTAAFAFAADESADPISKLGQRSALQRWKDARSEWMNPGVSRRERRQQLRNGGALDSTFAPDTAAPNAALPVEPAPVEPPVDPPGKVDLSPVFIDAEPELPQFIAPPRMEMHFAKPIMPVPPPVELLPPTQSPAEEPAAEITLPERAAVLDLSPKKPQAEVLARPGPKKDPDPPAPEQIPSPAPQFAAAEPTATTAYLPQIPRTPVQPTPAPPPTRVAPAPAPRLPEETVPRFEFLIPPAPQTGPAPAFAGPAVLPQLRKITDIQPFKNCSTDGSGIRMCPPNSAGAGADRCPEQQPLPVFEGEDRNFIDIEYCWEAPNLFHNPLYFEDVPLERYGHTYCEPLQSISSVGKFGAQLVGLPYQMALAPIHKREYPLGYYRPGDPAPYKCYQIPLNAEAAFKAAYFYTGMSFITP